MKFKVGDKIRIKLSDSAINYQYERREHIGVIGTIKELDCGDKYGFMKKLGPYYELSNLSKEIKKLSRNNVWPESWLEMADIQQEFDFS